MNLVIPKKGFPCSDFFLEEMKIRFKEIGYTIVNFPSNIKKCDIFLTFNQVGLNELKYLNRDIIIIDILMDHPMYSIRETNLFNNYYAFFVDRTHIDFVNRYYPDIKNKYFLPLGGSIREGLPLEERKYDICFTGNCTYNLNTKTEIANKMISILEKNKDFTIDEAYYSATNNYDRKKLFLDLNSWESADLYIRRKYRYEIMKKLSQKGFKIAVAGRDWDKLKNTDIDFLGEVSQEKILKLMCNSKFSLNVMPWFKDGAHDRIFSSLACGSLCFTDSSKYLKEIFTDKENIVFYDLDNIDGLCDKFTYYLNHLDEAKTILKNGRKLTINNHLWKNRVDYLDYFIKSL